MVLHAAIGTVTNLASRLSSLAEASQILTDNGVASDVRDLAAVRSLGPTDIKGFAEPVAVFELRRQ